ncbi:MAG: isoamylase [Candidatus Obscuribacterales bacterium]|nr:isoamylase [Candidatus Obscuribacterales bacterium]
MTSSDLLKEQKSDPRSEGWLADNVWHPFLNGTGAVQIYNNFTSNKLEPAYVAPAKTFSGDWAAQSLASAGGAILTYTVVGKAAGFGLNKLGSGLGLEGGAARFLASESTAQIVGAGLYDFAKAPNKGETRLGNAAGSVAAFGVFSLGNNLLARSKNIAESTLYSGLGRFAVGAAGGLTALETSHFVSSKLGVENKALGFDERWSAIANGGFVNFALPPIQKGLTTVVDHAVNAQPWGKGIPVERYLQYSKESLENRIADLDPKSSGAAEKAATLKEQLASLGDPTLRKLSRDNPFARVKELDRSLSSRADMGRNRVDFNPAEGPAKLAHELKHLRIGKLAEPYYQEIAQLAKANPLQAEADYYILRSNMESAARQAENIVAANQKNPRAVVENPLQLAWQVAGNGKTYFENWKSEWQNFQSNPKFRPGFEYSEAGSLSKVPAYNEMGAVVGEKGIQFGVRSETASKIEILIYDKASDKTPSRVIPLEKSGDRWHGFGDGLKEGTLYQVRAEGPNTPEIDGSRFNGKIGLIDPEAKAVSQSEIPLENRGGKAPENPGDMPKSIALKDSYDWGADRAPKTAMTDSVIYELNVRGYTGADSSLGKLKGTYRGLIEKIPHLKELGITAVELMPIMQGDRSPWPPKNPITGETLYDSWNYNQVGAYKAPDGSLAADGHLGQQVVEFKDMVKALHANNIEVVLDLVVNHTREGDAKNGPTASLRGIDNKNYYLTKEGKPGEYADHTGCGNTLNTNHPAAQDLIINAMRYWVEVMHVDGFRVDLATIFKYDVDGKQKFKTPIMERIENDPVLSKVKLIAEPWGPEQYYLGKFSDRLWSEWNGDFRDTVRKFVKSDSGQTGTLADRIAGSPGWFDAASGRYSVNGVTFHDGFTMNDLVTYNEKHNFANGEQNRDGSNDNFSWNSGYEGPVEKAPIPEAQKIAIEALRSKQVKNLMALLMLSRGTPHMVAGDEIRHSTFGNNNTWNQDKLNLIDWSLKEKNSDIFRFTKMMIELRKTHELGRLSPSSFIWHGTEPLKPDFADYTRLIAWQSKAPSAGAKSLYSAFNSYWEPITVTLPQGNWFRLVDTNLPAGQDIVAPTNATPIEKTYTIQPRSGIVLEGR